MKTPFLMSMILVLVSLVACGTATDELDSRPTRQTGAPTAPAPPAPAAPAPPGPPGPPGLPGNPGNQAAGGSLGDFARPAPAPPAAPAPAPAPSAPAPAPAPGFGGDGDFDASDEDTGANVLSSKSSDAQQATLVSQQRIIVRTVEMGLVVDEISDAIDEIADLAQRSNGWVVSSDRSSKDRGFISIRVPAEQLDGSILSLRNLAVEVDSEITSSQDVTDEYVDLTARMGNLEATEQALLKLLDRAEKVEDALNVQRELTRIQEDVERIQGRIKFLEETAAFSLINVRLRLSPIEMKVDAGLDQTYSVGQLARFRATFEPPDGIDEFTFVWDFGDGSPPIPGNRTAPSPDEGKRITTTITHQFFDDRDSPFIVEVEMTGVGDAGIAEGMDTIIATVTRIPTIEVFAGEGMTSDEGEEISFEGSFTRPQGLSELTFEWDFGDNSPPVTGSLDEGVTRAIATHAYSDNRPFPYTATLTITAQSDAGEAEASSAISVFVEETQGLVISGWSAGDTGKTAIRTLSGFGQVVGTVLIWLAIFSPVWIVLGIVIYWLNRNFRRRIRRVAEAAGPAPEQSARE